ncbi:gas vesicle protein [Candidatus Chloroploca sp. M-50]|uniref:Gas vesicle protein GvpJ n=2 Tax=Candidatus Chloroploca TaxID=1579476 RepID=A0A2H3KRB5_9CHLR|nr:MULTISPECIES: gas vesicle protein [Candidatus Chloroploca]MBP1467056.1 gas vesicle protein [Candidatus Chloroploca mongolica]PDW01089.1 gas vesicle protein GvpJ [Candidatus Chloroploca asiatica]
MASNQLQHSVQSTNLADILERVLDRGIVIAGDITISLVGVELLSIKIRLLVASVDKAMEMGINWWENDPYLTTKARELTDENKALQERIERLEAQVSVRQ